MTGLDWNSEDGKMLTVIESCKGRVTPKNSRDFTRLLQLFPVITLSFPRKYHYLPCTSFASIFLNRKGN